MYHHTKEKPESRPQRGAKTSDAILSHVGNQQHIGSVLASNLVHAVRVSDGRLPLQRHVCHEKETTSRIQNHVKRYACI